MKQPIYIAIDLKSFFASVECRDRGLDPLTTNLVVADQSRTDKTICLAVSPSLKKYGIPGRPRLFEVVQKVRQVNAQRKSLAPHRELTGQSIQSVELDQNNALAVDYLVAPPHMARYMEVSLAVYQIYLRMIAPEDIHVYSIDEVFIDATPYLELYGLSAHDLAMKLIQQVLEETGITATAGIGPNLYLCKIAMDIGAKHVEPDQNGVRIAELTEQTYKEKLWTHRPLTDFWRVGRGYAKKLEANGLYTMGDIARCSLGKPTDYYNEDLLYRLFGINAELLIDHAWGVETCTLKAIKDYCPSSRCLSSGQVLMEPYSWEKARLVVAEMAELFALDLVGKKLVTNQVDLSIAYDTENLTIPAIRDQYKGPVVRDVYGRQMPKSAHGSLPLKRYTSLSSEIGEAFLTLFDRLTDPSLLVRKITLTVNHIQEESNLQEPPESRQMSLFDLGAPQGSPQESPLEASQTAIAAASPESPLKPEEERRLQEAIVKIQKKYGKNALLKGMNYQEGATARERNRQIGGHKA